MTKSIYLHYFFAFSLLISTSTFSKQTRGAFDDINKRFDILENLVKDVGDTTENIEDDVEVILNKVCDIQSDIDELTDITISIGDVLESKLDNLQVSVVVSEIDQISELQSTTDSILDKVCDTLSIVEQIDDRTETIAETTESILEKVCLLVNPEFTLAQADFPQTITESGTYLLTENITFTGTGAALTIMINDVKIDLQKHCINGDGQGETGIMVEEGVTNVVITGGDINNFLLDGILTLTTALSVKISNLCLRNTDTGGSAIHFIGTSQSSVTNSVISNWANTNGGGSVWLESSHNNALSDLRIYSSGNAGLKIDLSENNCMEILAIWDSVCNGYEMIAEFGCDNFTKGVKCFRNGKNGFLIDGDVDGEVFIDCQATMNGENGFKVTLSNLTLLPKKPLNCLFQDCRAIRNGRAPAAIEDNGFFFEFGNACKIVSCTAIGNPGVGILLDDGMNNSVVINCRTLDNGTNFTDSGGNDVSTFTTISTAASWWQTYAP